MGPYLLGTGPLPSWNNSYEIDGAEGGSAVCAAHEVEITTAAATVGSSMLQARPPQMPGASEVQVGLRWGSFSEV